MHALIPLPTFSKQNITSCQFFHVIHLLSSWCDLNLWFLDTFFPLQITVSTAISGKNLFAKISKKKNPYLLKVSSDIPECSPCSFLLHKTCLISAFVMGYKIWVGFTENRSHIYCVSFHSCTHFTTHGAILDCCIKHLKKAKFNLWIFIDKSQLLHNLVRQQISPNIKLSKLPVRFHQIKTCKKKNISMLRKTEMWLFVSWVSNVVLLPR